VRRIVVGAATVAMAAALAGCSVPGRATGPTPTPVPELVIVTVTPAQPGTPRPAVAGSYTVANGDTLSGISARFGVSEDAIMAANGLANRDELYVGQELVIPPADSPG